MDGDWSNRRASRITRRDRRHLLQRHPADHEGNPARWELAGNQFDCDEVPGWKRGAGAVRHGPQGNPLSAPEPVCCDCGREGAFFFNIGLHPRLLLARSSGSREPAAGRNRRRIPFWCRSWNNGLAKRYASCCRDSCPAKLMCFVELPLGDDALAGRSASHGSGASIRRRRSPRRR